ncbi:dermonecrotic toxin domain-containing protein [Pseudomonas syringae]|uniref:Dermonecrotic toxin N-terminal domain-containing protein n=1 Tax=Pseudomonas syringae TaxID=317 RepID=A0A085VKU6_PSESX|nr:DUF6543 domain-containing protein [Pseudomonas syringae]KFE56059.1 hypothetical protein IV01_10395 [Pseudomonas syringae]
MSQDASSITEEPTTFTPSISAIREYRDRRQANLILDQFAERFTERNYFPYGGDGLLFAMLTQLPHWPADTELSVVDEEGDEIACYLKGSDAADIQHAVTLVQHADGSYAGLGNTNTYIIEPMFHGLFRQIPANSELGSGGDDFTDHSRIRVVRGQIAELAIAKRAQLLEALLADADLSKSENQDDDSNPFLPFWTPTPPDRPLPLWALRALNPQLPIERLEDLLNVLPLTHAQEIDLIHHDVLPEAFALALEDSKAEWARSREIDELLDAQADDVDTNNALPDWLKRLSDADRHQWSVALRDYNLTVLSAQEPGLPDVEMYGESMQIRDYARIKLRERLVIDHGLLIEPDDVIIETFHTQVTGVVVTPSLAGPGNNVEVVHSSREQRLTDLSLSNVAFTNINFLTTAVVKNAQGEPVSGLTASYIYDLVRGLNVGEEYPRFVKSSLLTSAQGRLYATRYARVMQAQMRFDALEAKMAGDFLDDGTSPAGQEDRGYKWVKAVVDHPVDDGNRGLVERHHIQVQKLRLNGIQLDGLLIIGTESSQAVATVVVYTPQAPDGKCLRELNNLEELRPILLDPVYLQYLVGMAPLKQQRDVRNALVNNWRTLIIDTRPYTGNFLEAAYEARIDRVIEKVDEQTNTTSEVNWQSAWDIIRIAGEVALIFTPFRIALPIAAIRSTYAVAQGLRDAAAGKAKEAESYFVEAALLLLDMIPFSKISKAKPAKIKPAQPKQFIDKYTGVLNFDARPAMPQLPSGLKLRTDGFYNGVHERVIDGQSSFYLVRKGKAYPVQPDHASHVWRMIDLRHPNASSKTPMFPDEQNVWRYHPPGGAGGGVYKLDLTGLEDAKIFKKLDQHIEDRVLKSIETIKTDFPLDHGSHGFHSVGKNQAKEKLYTFNIAGIPNDKGKGAWRLKVREPADNKGVLVFEEIMPWHKSKH